MTAKTTVGWREWCGLPDLGIPAIKAKVDTGARTTALHAFDTESFTRDGSRWLRFHLHPLQKNDSLSIPCEAPVLDMRTVMSSSGHAEERFVIATTLELCNMRWPIEVTLTRRDSLSFRMLLGREAMCSRLIVDPSKAFLSGRIPGRKLRELYGI